MAPQETSRHSDGTDMKKPILAASQIAALAGLNQLGYVCVYYLNLSIPGNLMGMLILLALLSSRIVRLSWIESGAQILLTHLAFFFVPIAVGLMAFTHSLLSEGISWLVTLVLAAASGILSAGFVTQTLVKRFRAQQQPSGA